VGICIGGNIIYACCLENSFPLIFSRDLKPGNIFLDRVNNMYTTKLGDFGLATKRQEKEELQISDNEEVDTIYNTIERGGGALLGQDAAVSASRTSIFSNAESVTVGVGTTFYRAPEQEQAATSGDSSYGVKADIFSLGIV
jgi:serine/threonine protein kinase